MKKAILLTLLLTGCEAVGPAVSALTFGVGEYTGSQRSAELNTKLDLLTGQNEQARAGIEQMMANDGLDTSAIAGTVPRPPKPEGWIPGVPDRAEGATLTAGLVALYGAFKKWGVPFLVKMAEKKAGEV